MLNTEQKTKIVFLEKYCLEIQTMPNSNNSIQILQNQIVLETIIKFSNYSHLICVHQFDAENSIFELKSQGLGEVSKFY